MYPQTTAGAQVGGYEILSRLAVGGMAELFLARARRALGFEKLIVLKRILPSLAHDPTFAAMFFDEARIAASLDHPNLIHVFDIDESAGTHYIAMEYVHGVDLRRLNSTLWSRGDRLPFDVAVTIGIGIAAGLHYAHERRDGDGEPLGLIHRDVSPSNVLLGFEGAVKVTDFGIAKATSRQAQTGSLKGKVLYMSPEQCNGGYLDRRSDVFALGTVLYEMTTGYRPFDAPAMVQLLRAIAEDDVLAPSSVRPGYPAALEEVVLCALAKNPDDRFPSAAHLQWALEEVARHQGYTVTAGTLGRYLGATLVESRMSPLELCAHMEQATSIPNTQSDVPVHEMPIEEGEATPNQRNLGLPAGTPRHFGGPLPVRESTATAEARLLGATTPASSPTPLPSPLGNQVTVTIPGEGVSRVPPRSSRGLAIFAVIMVVALLGGAGAAIYVLDRSTAAAVRPAPAKPTQAPEASAAPPAAAAPAAPVAGAAVETSARPGSDVEPSPAVPPAEPPEPAAATAEEGENAETAAAAAAEPPSPAREREPEPERERKRGRKRTPPSGDGETAKPPEKPGWDLNSPFPPGE